MFYNVISTLHQHVTMVLKDALLQVLQWQNMHVSAFPSKMTMVFALYKPELKSFLNRNDRQANILSTVRLKVLWNQLLMT